jgi:hypothetical protein
LEGIDPAATKTEIRLDFGSGKHVFSGLVPVKLPLSPAPIPA